MDSCFSTRKTAVANMDATASESRVGRTNRSASGRQLRQTRSKLMCTDCSVMHSDST